MGSRGYTEHDSHVVSGSRASAGLICRHTHTEIHQSPAPAQTRRDNNAESDRRDILVGLERTRIDVAFIGQLLNEAGDARTILRIEAVLSRLDDMITQVAEPRRTEISEE
jgi:hypothetical protein